MRYRRLTGLLGLLLLALPSAAVIAQGYELSGKSYEMTWPKGKWNGKFGFPGVYCVTFPMPDKAERLTTAMFNRNAINLTRVVYPDRLAATIAISTVTGPGRPPSIFLKAASTMVLAMSFSCNFQSLALRNA